jgi:hypothetical protein
MESSGGGGFGDPLEREPTMVVADLAEGYVTLDAAAAIYGVVLVNGAVDATATAARRAQLRAARHRVRLDVVDDVETERGRAIRIDETTARALGVGVGGVVELMNLRGAPLRAWVIGLLPENGFRARIAPAALRMLALADTAEVEVRAVHSGTLPG